MIAGHSHSYRPLGLGLANLGALLKSMGVPRRADRGRSSADSITAVMCGQAYLTRAKIPEILGPFADYEKNLEPFLVVIKEHR